MTTIDHDPLPPNDLELRRRVMSATEDLSDLLKDMGDRMFELHDLGVPADEWLDLVVRHAPDVVGSLYSRYGGFVGGLIDGYLDARKANAKTGMEGVAAALVGQLGRATKEIPLGDPVRPQDPNDERGPAGALTPEGFRMHNVIGRLFAEAPKLTDAKGAPDPTQAPALECTVILRNGGQMTGALSITPEHTLRMLCPNEMEMGPPGKGNRKPVMIEHFFDYEQIADVALVREVSASGAGGSGIITS